MKLFRERLLARLVERHAISEDLVRKLLAWRHPGFSAHVGEAFASEDKKAIEDVACYLVRAPLSLKKLVYLDGQKAVLYRSRMNPSLGRNLEAMDPLEWLERRADQIPDTGKHRTHFYGFYASQVRASRRETEASNVPAEPTTKAGLPHALCTRWSRRSTSTTWSYPPTIEGSGSWTTSRRCSSSRHRCWARRRTCRAAARLPLPRHHAQLRLLERPHRRPGSRVRRHDPLFPEIGPERRRQPAGPGLRGSTRPDDQGHETGGGSPGWSATLRHEPSREIRLRTSPAYAPDVRLGPVSALTPLVAGDAEGAPVRSAARALDMKLGDVEDGLIQRKLTGRGQDGTRWPSQLVSKLTYLASCLAGDDFPPTDQEKKVHALLEQRLATSQARLDEIRSKDLAAFNDLLKQRSVPNVVARRPAAGESR